MEISNELVFQIFLPK